MIQWTIGTTTVRNPDRLRDGLSLFAEGFAGRPWDEERQAAFFDALVAHRVYETDADAHARMKTPRKQEHARKWISVLNQLGFCNAYKGGGSLAELTPAGEALLRSPQTESEVFLRQIWKYQKPAPLPNQNGPSFAGVEVRPGWLSVRIACDLHTAGLGGIAREEMTLFLTTTLRNADAPDTLERIQRYRADRKRVTGAVAKRQVFAAALRARVRELLGDEHAARREKLEALAVEGRRSPSFLRSFEADALLDDLVRGGKGARTRKAQETKRALLDGLAARESPEALQERLEAYHDRLRMDTLKDYADLTSRYLRKTGLFTIRGDQLAALEDRLPLIETLLEEPPAFRADEAYLDELRAADLPRLPTDDVAFLRKEIRLLTEQQERVVEQYPELTFRLFSPPRSRSADPDELKGHAEALRQNVALLREMQFFHRQSEPAELEETLATFDAIDRRELLGGEAYRPAYYEWAVWRFLLAISAPRDGRRALDALPETTRGFKVDEAMQPLHHAAAGAADMVFPFAEYALVVEVTLNTRENQWSAEGEPVPRHVAMEQARRSKPVYGLFIAPVIEPNTALTFHRCRHYVNGRIADLAIMPLTTDQFRELIRAYLCRPFGPQEFLVLIRRLDESRGAEENPLKWMTAIAALLRDWIQEHTEGARLSLVAESGMAEPNKAEASVEAAWGGGKGA